MKGKILVVEDNEEFAGVLRRWFTKQNYMVISASDGHEAIVKYIDEKPTLIILDIMLPKLNGFEVCRVIRRKLHDVLTPIIMMTGNPGDYERVKGKVLGATEYLIKPFGPQKLMDEIRNLPHQRI